jgi:hypothetical protein
MFVVVDLTLFPASSMPGLLPVLLQDPSHRFHFHLSPLVTTLSLHSSGLFHIDFLACQVSLVPPVVESLTIYSAG